MPPLKIFSALDLIGLNALALALLSASPGQGALLMLGFGLGTLPMLLAMGRAAEYLDIMARKPVLRRLAGVAIILFGTYTLLTAGDLHHVRHPLTPHSDSGIILKGP